MMRFLAEWVCERGANWRWRLSIVMCGMFVVGALVAVLLAGSASAAVNTKPTTAHGHAAMLPPIGDYPDAPCEDPEIDGGNFYLGPTGDFWECICEVRTFVPNDCAWYNQGPISGAETRKLKVKLRRTTLPRGRVINTKLWRVMPL